MIAWLGAFIAIASLATVQYWTKFPMILGSFGASCLLIFAYPFSPFAQPRNVIGGHMIASFVGLAIMALFGVTWWSMALAVSTAIAMMLIFRVPHPPAGSNPLIIMLGGAKWSFLINPTFVGAVIVVLIALIYNNVGKDKQYPVYWI
ncbi:MULTISPECIES: HPP family protein [unclassified Acinetobacter]|uniref:HPP family protein n=1 Tax=unclassified Acinetobacter TaxID=196816 RepID=UPI0035BAB178